MNLKTLAKERIAVLLKEAELVPEKKDRYAELILKIAKKAEMGLPKSAKMKICRKCKKFIMPDSLIIRTNKKTKCVEYTCKKCGSKRRYSYSKKKN